MDAAAGAHTCPRNHGTWYETLGKDEASLLVLTDKRLKIWVQVADTSCK